MCTNQIITEWKEEEIRGIKVSGNKDSKTLLFTDDHITMVDSEGALQICIHEVERGTSKYGLKISTSNTKTMAFKEKDQ
jgi:hypothetical protein